MGLWQTSLRGVSFHRTRILDNNYCTLEPRLLTSATIPSSWKEIRCFGLGVSLSVAIAACSGGNANTGGSASPGSEKGDVELAQPTLSPAQPERSFLGSPLNWKQEHSKTLPLTKAMVGLTPKLITVIDGLEADVVALA